MKSFVLYFSCKTLIKNLDETKIIFFFNSKSIKKSFSINYKCYENIQK